MKKFILLAAGNISLSLGIVGVFVPLLPTTPFLLLAAGCYLRSSDRLYTWLIRHKRFGTYIRCYLKYRAMAKHSKIISLFLLWGAISVSMIFFIPTLWVRILLAAVAIGVTVHIVSLRTLTREMIEEVTVPPVKNVSRRERHNCRNTGKQNLAHQIRIPQTGKPNA
ncbi:MAG: YbaN family protein [Spirochaetales bacterium]|nr:YbaN family protein [Spirochaetales bacterium]